MIIYLLTVYIYKYIYMNVCIYCKCNFNFQNINNYSKALIRNKNKTVLSSLCPRAPVRPREQFHWISFKESHANNNV